MQSTNNIIQYSSPATYAPKKKENKWGRSNVTWPRTIYMKEHTSMISAVTYLFWGWINKIEIKDTSDT